MSLLRTRCLTLAAVALLAVPLHRVRAQGDAESFDAALHGTGAHIFLVTIGQGPLLWERFGHSAIIVHDPPRGIDAAYNWGLFDFRSPRLWLHFIMGHPEYQMGAEDVESMLDFYEQSDRGMDIQELALTPTQTAALERLLAWNAQPEHRSYRYDYYRDNCSTRVRDALDQILGGELRSATEGRITAFTYRSETRRLLIALPWASFVSTLVFGRHVDRPLSAWQSLFIPMRLRDEMRALPATGAPNLPLVTQEWTIPVRGDAIPTSFAVPPDVVWTLAVSVAMLLVVAAAWYAHGHDHPIVERASLVIIAGWMVLTGIAGLILAFAWLVTDHVFTRSNDNLLLANPLALWVAWTLARSVMRPASRARAGAARSAVVLSAFAIVAVAMSLFPATHQANGEIIALFAPTTLATTLLFAAHARPEEESALDAHELAQGAHMP